MAYADAYNNLATIAPSNQIQNRVNRLFRSTLSVECLHSRRPTGYECYRWIRFNSVDSTEYHWYDMRPNCQCKCERYSSHWYSVSPDCQCISYNRRLFTNGDIRTRVLSDLVPHFQGNGKRNTWFSINNNRQHWIQGWVGRMAICHYRITSQCGVGSSSCPCERTQ